MWISRVETAQAGGRRRTVAPGVVGHLPVPDAAHIRGGLFTPFRSPRNLHLAGQGLTACRGSGSPSVARGRGAPSGPAAGPVVTQRPHPHLKR